MIDENRIDLLSSNPDLYIRTIDTSTVTENIYADFMKKYRISNDNLCVNPTTNKRIYYNNENIYEYNSYMYKNNPKIKILNEVIWNEEPSNFYDIFLETPHILLK